ncbi:MAG: hypothetical protein MR497_03110 [Bacilli bacterium]|nr:hypothetical protein [Bacilli bacterium]
MFLDRRLEDNFSKVGLVIYKAFDAMMKDTVKILKNNMESWVVKKVFSFEVTTLKMKRNCSDYKRKDKDEKR